MIKEPGLATSASKKLYISITHTEPCKRAFIREAIPEKETNLLSFGHCLFYRSPPHVVWETFHFFCVFPEGWGSKDRLFQKYLKGVRTMVHGAPWRFFLLHWDRGFRIEYDNKIRSVDLILKSCNRHLAFGFGICPNYIILIAPRIFSRHTSIFQCLLPPQHFYHLWRSPGLSAVHRCLLPLPARPSHHWMGPSQSSQSSLPSLLLSPSASPPPPPSLRFTPFLWLRHL